MTYASVQAPSPLGSIIVMVETGGGAPVASSLHIVAPMPSVYGGIDAESSMQLNIIAPAATVSAHISRNGVAAVGTAGVVFALGGAKASATGKVPQVQASATVTTIGRAALVAPLPQVNAMATAGVALGTAAPLQGKAPLVQARGGAAPVAITAPQPQVQAGVLTGVAMRAALVAPKATAQAHMTAGGLSFAHIVGKAFAPVPSLRAAITAPSPVVRASGGFVALAEFEAYAVNLETSIEGGGYEVTRYTNFPFSNVVKAHGRYFGVAGDGLWALQGQTDAGTPTPWSVRLATTDFGEAQRKHVAAGYVGGRLGDAAEFEVLCGEDQQERYAYQNLRGSRGQNYRCKFGRGMVARYFSFGLSGSGAAEIHNMEFDVQQRTRRI